LRKTKTNEVRQIAISDDLEKVLKEIRKKNQLKSEYVFTYRGKPVQEVKKAFGASLARAGIEDFRFHDLRHTFASHMVMRGATIKDVQELLGHKDIKMTIRYAHLSKEHKKKPVNLLKGLTSYVKSDKSQMFTFPPSEQKKRASHIS
jgi:integrase